MTDNSGVTVCQPVQGTQQLADGACLLSEHRGQSVPAGSDVRRQRVRRRRSRRRLAARRRAAKVTIRSAARATRKGISGACDLTLVDPTSNKELYHVCTYRQRCEPFQVEPCKAGETCLVEDKVGHRELRHVARGRPTANRARSATTARTASSVSATSMRSVCHYACVLPGSTNPFDAGVQSGGRGRGRLSGQREVQPPDPGPAGLVRGLLARRRVSAGMNARVSSARGC